MSAAEETVSAPGAREDVPRNPEDARTPTGTPGQPEETPPTPGEASLSVGDAERTPGDAERTPGDAEQTPPVPRAELAAGDELQRLVTRWKEIQAEFVDEPRTAVVKADELVAETAEMLAAMFARERSALGQRWSGSGTSTDTEALRQSLRRYRALFERLLAA
jgi:hypothetical protein